MSDYEGIEYATEFNTKLAGVTFEGRQDIIRGWKAGDNLVLMREPQNRFDSNAIAVIGRGGQGGFLNAALAAHIAPVMDTGYTYKVVVTDVTGGEDGQSLGVNVLVHKEVHP